MNFTRRAMLSVIRRPEKSALLMAVIFILGVVIAGAMSVQQALQNTKSMLAQTIGITSTIKFNSFLLQQKLEEQPDLRVEALTPEIIETIGASSFVKSYEYKADIPLSYKTDNGGISFTLGCRQKTEFEELSSGAISVVKGRGLAEADRESKQRGILMSVQAAEQLGMSVGSTLELQKDVFYGKELKETLKYSFFIVGLFDAKSTQKQASGTTGKAPSYAANLYILMDSATGIIEGINEAEIRIGGINAQLVNVVPTFVLRSREEVGEFGSLVGALIPNYYAVSDNTEQFDYMISPASGMEWIAQVILLASIAVSIVIISLMVTLSIRDRRREMGTYFSIGERKGHIALQIMLEIMTAAVIALSASMLVGNAVAGAVSGEMLKSQVANAIEEEKKHVVVSGSIDSQVILENYSVTLDGATILYFYGAGLLTAALSAVTPVLYTLRLNPKKILLM